MANLFILLFQQDDTHLGEIRGGTIRHNSPNQDDASLGEILIWIIRPTRITQLINSHFSTLQAIYSIPSRSTKQYLQHTSNQELLVTPSITSNNKCKTSKPQNTTRSFQFKSPMIPQFDTPVSIPPISIPHSSIE